MANVTIYSTPTCGYCNVAKEFFKANNVAYTEKNVASDLVAREEMLNKTHQMGVPVIDVDGHLMIGYNKAKLASLLGVPA
jgi:glutaredoxin 3